MFKSGDTIYEIGKLKNTENYFTVSIFKRTLVERVKDSDTKWWLKNSQGAFCGSCEEKDMFITKVDAMREIVKRI